MWFRCVVPCSQAPDVRDPKHVDWVRSFTALLEELRKYIMEFHTTGLTWNPKVSLPTIATDFQLSLGCFRVVTL